MHRIALLAVLAAIVGAGAVPASAYAAEPDTIGATVESRIYMDERSTMMILSRSTVPATLAFEATGGWRVEPATLTLDPEQEAEVNIVGSGEDGALINVRVMPADPTPGALSGVALLSARVFYERPFDPMPLVLAAAALFLVALLLSVRLALRGRARTG